MVSQLVCPKGDENDTLYQLKHTIRNEKDCHNDSRIAAAEFSSQNHRNELLLLSVLL